MIGKIIGLTRPRDVDVVQLHVEDPAGDCFLLAVEHRPGLRPGDQVQWHESPSFVYWTANRWDSVTLPLKRYKLRQPVMSREIL